MPPLAGYCGICGHAIDDHALVYAPDQLAPQPLCFKNGLPDPIGPLTAPPPHTDATPQPPPDNYCEDW